MCLSLKSVEIMRSSGQQIPSKIELTRFADLLALPVAEVAKPLNTHDYSSSKEGRSRARRASGENAKLGHTNAQSVVVGAPD